MSNIHKHKILKLLQKTYTDKSYSGTNYTEEGKSLSTEDLHGKTGLHLDKLNLILSSLMSYDYVKSTLLHDGKGLTYYYITDKGRDALLDKRFVWYSLSWNKVLNIITIVISIISLIVAILKKD